MPHIIECPTCGKPLQLGKNAFKIVLISDKKNGEYEAFLDCGNLKCKDFNKRHYKITLTLSKVEDYETS